MAVDYVIIGRVLACLVLIAPWTPFMNDSPSACLIMGYLNEKAKQTGSSCAASSNVVLVASVVMCSRAIQTSGYVAAGKGKFKGKDLTSTRSE